jgi:NADH dehydrogenase
MKTLEDARGLRSRIPSAFEMAETVVDPEQRAAFSRSPWSARDPLVELVGQVAELPKGTAPRVSLADTDKETRVVLIEASGGTATVTQAATLHPAAVEKMGVEGGWTPRRPR